MPLVYWMTTWESRDLPCNTDISVMWFLKLQTFFYQVAVIFRKIYTNYAFGCELILPAMWLEV